jgi:multisubunit Na+/H+ antiporter MnhC subunit
MKFLSIFLMAFGLMVIIYPQFLAYLIGFFFIFVWVNMFLVTMQFGKWKTNSGEEFVKFWKYVIYKK